MIRALFPFFRAQHSDSLRGNYLTSGHKTIVTVPLPGSASTHFFFCGFFFLPQPGCITHTERVQLKNPPLAQRMHSWPHLMRAVLQLQNKTVPVTDGPFNGTDSLEVLLRCIYYSDQKFARGRRHKQHRVCRLLTSETLIWSPSPRG